MEQRSSCSNWRKEQDDRAEIGKVVGLMSCGSRLGVMCNRLEIEKQECGGETAIMQ